jgi:hypothetical protein
LPAAVAHKATLIQQLGPKGPPGAATGLTSPLPGQTPQANLPLGRSQQPGLPPGKLQRLPGTGVQPPTKPLLAPAAPSPTRANRPGSPPATRVDRTPPAGLPRPSGPPAATVTPSPGAQGTSSRPGVPAGALPHAPVAAPSGPTIRGSPAATINAPRLPSQKIVNQPPPKPPSPNINRPAPPPAVVNRPPPPVAVTRQPPAPVMNRPSPPPPAAAARPMPQAAKKCVVQNGKQVCQ